MGIASRTRISTKVADIYFRLSWMRGGDSRLPRLHLSQQHTVNRRFSLSKPMLIGHTQFPNGPFLIFVSMLGVPWYLSATFDFLFSELIFG
jgi:hypothetical protein